MRKSILIVAFFLASLGTYGQITLEHTYDDSGLLSSHVDSYNNIRYGAKPLYLVHLEDEDKYVRIDKTAQIINFYSLDHSFWKSIDYSGVSIVGPNVEISKLDGRILYISRHLFDTDDEIEFIYTFSCYDGIVWSLITEIVNEDGSKLFSQNALLCSDPSNDQFIPIYNTSEGTKMILSNLDGKVDIYSLPGSFTPEIAQNNILEEGQMRLFPNPSTGGGQININYQLPPESTKADLFIYNSQGKQVKSYQIGGENTNFQLNSNDLLKGTYFYTIRTPEGKSIASQKLIIIE